MAKRKENISLTKMVSKQSWFQNKASQCLLIEFACKRFTDRHTKSFLTFFLNESSDLNESIE